MDITEAREWLDGKRSMMNIIQQEPLETWDVRIAQADAAMMEQAYWFVKAHEEFKVSSPRITQRAGYLRYWLL